MKTLKLISLLLAVIMLTTALASCDILPFPLPGSVSEDKEITVEFVVDGISVKTETYNTKDLTPDALYTPDEREGYRFIGWFSDASCEMPADLSDIVTNKSNTVIKLYGKYLPIGGGVAGCNHFWILGYCRL